MRRNSFRNVILFRWDRFPVVVGSDSHFSLGQCPIDLEVLYPKSGVKMNIYGYDFLISLGQIPTDSADYDPTIKIADFRRLSAIGCMSLRRSKNTRRNDFRGSSVRRSDLRIPQMGAGRKAGRISRNK